MTPDISEGAFEDAIERALLRHGPDAYPEDAGELREPAASYGDDPLPGSFHKRSSKDDYDRNLCLVPGDVLDFFLATQPKEWEKLKQHYGADVKPRFLGRLSREIARRGALDVLRNGVRDSGCKFRLAYFQPASGLNEETPAPPRGEPLRRRTPAPLQRKDRRERRPRTLPERHPNLHG